jgi:hypothetical protein
MNLEGGIYFTFFLSFLCLVIISGRYGFRPQETGLHDGGYALRSAGKTQGIWIRSFDQSSGLISYSCFVFLGELVLQHDF